MLIDDLLGQLLSYGSGLALGIAIGVFIGVYFVLIFHKKYLDYRAVKHPGEAIEKAIREYRRLNDSLYEAERFLDYPELVTEEKNHAD